MSDHTQGIDVDALAELVKKQAALIDRLEAENAARQPQANRPMLDINDVRAQPDPTMREWTMVFKPATKDTDPANRHEVEGHDRVAVAIEHRIVKSSRELEQAVADGWRRSAYDIVAERAPKPRKAA